MKLFALFAAMTALCVSFGPAEATWPIVMEIRLPRVLTAGLVGAALALAGALLQGLFRNPLACPGIIGVSAGGALGASLGLAAGLASISIWSLPVAAFAGASGAAFLIFALSARGGLILCGIAVNSTAGAATALVLALSVRDWEVARQVWFWLMGGLNNRSWVHVALISPFLFASLLVSLKISRELDLLQSGEEVASSLGVDVSRMKKIILIASAAAAGASVAVAGVVGFVGLVVPHIVRRFVGPHHRRLIPACLVFGACFVMAIDLACRTVIGREEIGLGVVASAFGGPFFLFLLIRRRDELSG
jgi:iron complex transport system permease protein